MRELSKGKLSRSPAGRREIRMRRPACGSMNKGTGAAVQNNEVAEVRPALGDAVGAVQVACYFITSGDANRLRNPPRNIMEAEYVQTG